MSSKAYSLRRPCAKCPFRHDVPGYLEGDRIYDIACSDGEFHCHETTVESEDGDEMISTKDSKHCAGFLIFREKIEHPSQMMRIAERLGMYDHTKLDMEAPVFDDLDDLVEHHEAKNPGWTEEEI